MFAQNTSIPRWRGRSCTCGNVRGDQHPIVVPQNRWLFHLPSQAEIRAQFAKRNEGEDRNRWLYSYNPLTVELK